MICFSLLRVCQGDGLPNLFGNTFILQQRTQLGRVIGEVFEVHFDGVVGFDSCDWDIDCGRNGGESFADQIRILGESSMTIRIAIAKGPHIDILFNAHALKAGRLLQSEIKISLEAG